MAVCKHYFQLNIVKKKLDISDISIKQKNIDFVLKYKIINIIIFQDYKCHVKEISELRRTPVKNLDLD